MVKGSLPSVRRCGGSVAARVVRAPTGLRLVVAVVTGWDRVVPGERAFIMMDISVMAAI
jgi:hypothetical protein